MLPVNELDLFYDNIINEWEEQYGYEGITEEDINQYFTEWFYQLEDEIELDILNDAEEYVRKRTGLED